MNQSTALKHHAHDTFVRTVMSDLRVARDFFNSHLPQDLLSKIDLNHLVLQPRSYIDEVRKESIVDLLYKTMLDKEEIYLYILVEHQSRPDELMPFRILKYTCNVMDDHLKTLKQNKLPLIYPMVIYHGRRPYPYTTDIRDLIAAPKTLIDQYFLQPFQLIDLGQIEDENLKKHAWAGVMEFVLKHIYARDILPSLQEITELMRRVVQSGGEDYISIVLQYALEKGELQNKSAFFNLINTKISSNVGEKVMTLAEQIRAEGRQEGKIEGKLEGKIEGKIEGKLEGKIEGKLEVAERLLSEGIEVVFVAKMTGISLDKLKILQEEA